jgi:hypothetical protein
MENNQIQHKMQMTTIKQKQKDKQRHEHKHQPKHKEKHQPRHKFNQKHNHNHERQFPILETSSKIQDSWFSQISIPGLLRTDLLCSKRYEVETAWRWLIYHKQFVLSRRSVGCGIVCCDFDSGQHLRQDICWSVPHGWLARWLWSPYSRGGQRMCSTEYDMKIDTVVHKIIFLLKIIYPPKIWHFTFA